MDREKAADPETHRASSVAPPRLEEDDG